MCKMSIAKFLFSSFGIATVPQLCHGALSQPKDIAFKAEVDGTEQYYVEMLPADFEQNKKYDLVIGLHGHGSDRQQFATGEFGEADAFREFASKYNMIAVRRNIRGVIK